MGTQPADAISRLPCPHCAEPIALEARLCHHCQSSALVDVALSTAVTDPRVRYQVARAIQALPGAPPLSAVQTALTSTPPAAVRGVTRAFGHDVLALLARQGLRGSLEAGPAFDAPAKRSRLVPAAGGVGLAVLVLIGITAWRQAFDDLAKPVAPATGAPPAAPVKAATSALTARQIAQKSLPSTVSLRCLQSVGSGFFITEELVLTNAHVLCPPSEPIQVVLSDGRKLRGTAERSDPTVDLGLVRVREARVPALPIGDVSDLAPGDKVTIIGSPVGLEFTVHEGSVSSLQRSMRGIAYVQLDAKINPGNSGGPVIDAQGRVVGVVTLKHMGAEGIGLALPINYAYSEGLRFVFPPNPEAALSSAFAKMMARAREENDGKAETAEGGGGGLDRGLFPDRPLLVGADVDQFRRLVIRVLRITQTPPRYEEVSIKVWNQGENFCTIKGDISTWKEIDENGAGPALPPELMKALRQNGAGRVFLGESPLRWDLCNRDLMRRGIQIELDGGHPKANRLTL